MNQRSEKWISIAIGVCVFLYVLLRAIFVPTFHDEAATFFHYIVPGKFVPFHAHWDANNHFLNSALAYYSYRIFGPELTWIRLPNVLAFIIYIGYAFRLTRSLSSALIRNLTYIALLTAAFPLEFFAEARGYGMSLAFMLGAIFHGWRFLQNGSPKDQLLVWFWMTLAVAANLALANSYLIFLGLVFIALVKHPKGRLVNTLVYFLGLGVFGAAAYYGFELRERGLLYTGFDDGFLEVTVRSLNLYQFGTEAHWLRWLIAVIGASTSIYLIYKVARNRFEWTVGSVVAAVLLLNAIGSVLLNLLFGMNFPENRVGIYYIPLFILTLGAALNNLSVRNLQLKYVSLVLLFFPIHLLANMNLDTTLLWKKWHVSEKMFDRAYEMQEKMGRQLTISGHYLNELGWAFYNFKHGSPMQLMQREPVPDTLADLIIARPYDFDIGSIDFDTVHYDQANDVYLLHRPRRIEWSEQHAITPKLISFSGSDEFYELLNDSISALQGRTGRFSLVASVQSEERLFDGQLVVTAYDSTGESVWYDYIPMHWILPEWNGDTLRIERTFQFPEGTQTCKIYFFNVNRQHISVSIQDFHVRVPK